MRSHGIDCDVWSEPRSGAVAERLLAKVADIGADVLVAGGYGHSRLRERVLGGVTESLLSEATVPILFAH